MLALGRLLPPGLISAALVVACSQVGFAQSAGRDRPNRADCGTNALFVLLHMEGHPVTLDRLEGALPSRHRDGYSMAELSAASASLGLELEGVRFGKDHRPLERPAIAFLDDAQGGHFVVMRPVGTTGTRVQVIDHPYPPGIVDYEQVVASHDWSGAILVARDPHHLRNSLVVASGLLVVLAVVRWSPVGFLLRKRSSRGFGQPRPDGLRALHDGA